MLMRISGPYNAIKSNALRDFTRVCDGMNHVALLGKDYLCMEFD
jgi:hypothetical protein